jgi:ribonuclease P protein component
VNSGPAVSETFSKDDRLRKRREFEECYASGVRVSGRHIQVFLLADPTASASNPRPRLGISVPRRVGTAVTRNLVRRRLREIFRRTRPLLGSVPARLVVNARPSSAAAAFSELLEDYESAVTRALLRPPRPAATRTPSRR